MQVTVVKDHYLATFEGQGISSKGTNLDTTI